MKCVQNVHTRKYLLIKSNAVKWHLFFYHIRSLFQNSPVHNLFRQMLNSLSLEMLCDTQLRITLKLTKQMKTSTLLLVKM